MSRFSAVVNNSNSQCIGDVKKTNKNQYLIEGRFLWTLPYSVEMLPQNQWAVRAAEVFLSSNISPFKKSKIFSILIENTKTNEVFRANLSDYAGSLDYAEDFVELFESILTPNFRDKVKMTFAPNEGHFTMTVEPDIELSLGIEIVDGLDIKDQAAFVGQEYAQFKKGEYKSHSVNPLFPIFGSNKERLVYLCFDCVAPSIFGRAYQNIVCSLNPSDFNNSPPEIYHDIVQNPLRFVEIYFIDNSGQLINFVANDPTDFIFSLTLEFKNLAMGF